MNKPATRKSNESQSSTILAGVAILGLATGGALWWSGNQGGAGIAWSIATAPVLLGLFVQIVTSLRRGDVGLDIVAALSMSAALGFGEPLAGNVVALMYAGGQLLENFAQGRARREMTALLGRVARTAMCYRDGVPVEVPIETLKPGDRLLIRQGEVLPVDGHVVGSVAVLDLSALTGESVPQKIDDGGETLSGATSAGPAFDLVASRAAADSTYAGIVRLVEAAQATKPPMVRLADRYAVWFLGLTLVISGLAWFLTGDPHRALAVLVVATPCPLILAVPVALISGMSRAAGIGVLVKSGAVFESLALVRTAILDKTGTLTDGSAVVTQIRTTAGITENEVLRLAASADLASTHVVAAALIKAARSRNLTLSPPEGIVETAGEGVVGRVDRLTVAVGGKKFVGNLTSAAAFTNLGEGLAPSMMTVALAVDGVPKGLIVLEDPVRGDASDALSAFREAGISRIVLASGDRSDIANHVGASLGVDLVLGDLDPMGKISAIQAEAKAGPVMMVGDGVNDAPALAAASVGVAMGARGAAASSEAAGVVVLVDALFPLAKAITIARRTRTIALESVAIGIGLSIAAMVVAALGYLPPVQGALFQEVIDVAVILNALRALR